MCDLYREEEGERGPRSGISELVDELVVAATNLRIYWAEHPRVSASLQRLEQLLGRLFEGRPDEKLFLGRADGCLFFDRVPLVGASVSAPRIVRRLRQLGSGGIAFGRQARTHELAALVKQLGEGSGDQPSFHQANRLLEHDGCLRLRFLPEYSAEGAAGAAGEAGATGADGPSGGLRLANELPSELETPIKLYGTTVELLQEAVVSANHGQTLSLESAELAVGEILARLDRDAPTMRSITRYERYDAYTFGHSIHVCTLAMSFARELIDDRALVRRIGMAGLLHDIGKAWVPFEVLHSTQRLDAEERLEMNKHAEHGARILLGQPQADPLVVASAFGHHRTHDGGGYPETALRTEQSVGTKIVKICDVYEALTAVRPYKERLSPLASYRVMMAMGSHFDPGLLRRFIETNGLYPVGSEVELSDGARARVLRPGKALERPVVGVLDADGATGADVLDLEVERGVRIARAA